MSYFPGAHLKVTSPVTTDGMNLRYDGAGRPMTRVTFLPLSARKELEKKNLKLPTHLRKTIEVMEPYNEQIPVKRSKAVAE